MLFERITCSSVCFAQSMTGSAEHQYLAVKVPLHTVCDTRDDYWGSLFSFVGFAQVIEIAPAFGLDESVRKNLHEAAVKIAKHCGYVCLPPYLLFSYQS